MKTINKTTTNTNKESYLESIDVLFYKASSGDNNARVQKSGRNYDRKYIASGGGYNKEGFAVLLYLKDMYPELNFGNLGCGDNISSINSELFKNNKNYIRIDRRKQETKNRTFYDIILITK